MKCLGINLSKQLHDMHLENYKMLMKEIKNDLKKWRDAVFKNQNTQHSKDVNLPKLMSQYNLIPTEIQQDFYRYRQTCSKIYKEAHSI